MKIYNANQDAVVRINASNLFAVSYELIAILNRVY